MAGPVTRSDLRGIRWSVAVIVLGVALIGTSLVIKTLSDHDRCLAGNEFRESQRQAFAEYTAGLGEEFNAEPEQVEAFVVRFDERLAELFPPRDCPLLG